MDDLKQLTNILNNNSGLELRFIYSKEEYNKYQIGDLISVYGFKAKIINKQEYLRADKYTASITYQILARIIVEEIEGECSMENNKVTIYNVECPVDKVRQIILNEYPNYYMKSAEVKFEMIRDFVKESGVDIMYNYMEETKGVKRNYETRF